MDRADAGPRARHGLSALHRAKVLFFVAAGLAFLASVYLWFSGSREQGIFVGLWVPSILSGGALLLVGEEPRE